MHKKSWGNTNVFRFLQSTWFYTQRKDEANGFPKEIITAIMMFYKNTKVMVCSPNGGINFFDIVAGVLQGDTLAL